MTETLAPPSDAETVHSILISEIFIGHRQRREMDGGKIQELANDIAQRGLLHPVVVRPPHPDEDTGGLPYVLMVGGRRLAAHLVLLRPRVPARLKSDLSPLEARVAELSENVVRVNLSWQEETDARAELAEALRILKPSATQEDIAAEVGVSQPQLSKDLVLHKALKADPKLRDLNSKGSALRAHVFKKEIGERITNLQQTEGNKLETLKSKLFIGKAEQFVRTIPDASVDLVFSDLPYGINFFEVVSDANKGVYDDDTEKCKAFIQDVVPHALRIVKPTGWVVFFMCYEWHNWLQRLISNVCDAHFAYRVTTVDQNGVKHPEKFCLHSDPDHAGDCAFSFQPEMPPWIWTRRGEGNNGHWPELHASNRYEMLVVVNGGAAKLTKKPVENVLDFEPFKGERLHSMQKPHPLCKEIIERTTVPGELVLDLCFGSGAHLAAAAELGRDFVGSEENPEQLPKALQLVAQYWQGPRKPLSLVKE